MHLVPYGIAVVFFLAFVVEENLYAVFIADTLEYFLEIGYGHIVIYKIAPISGF